MHTYLGVLITGGDAGTDNLGTNSAEIYLPDSSTSCILPVASDLLLRQSGHTQDVVCGSLVSNPDTKYCSKWTNGVWTQSHKLRNWRLGHVSWATASGVYLLGGIFSPKSSELVKEDGSVEDGFPLKYETK